VELGRRSDDWKADVVKELLDLPHGERAFCIDSAGGGVFGTPAAEVLLNPIRRYDVFGRPSPGQADRLVRPADGPTFANLRSRFAFPGRQATG
jgi:hypothetical protein